MYSGGVKNIIFILVNVLLKDFCCVYYWVGEEVGVISYSECKGYW